MDTDGASPNESKIVYSNWIGLSENLIDVWGCWSIRMPHFSHSHPIWPSIIYPYHTHFRSGSRIPRRRGRQPSRRGRQPTILPQFSTKLHEIYKIVGRGGEGAPGCARFAVFLQKYFEFQILWSLSSVDFFLSKSKSQFQLDFNLRFVFVLDTLQSQWCRNIFLKIDF